MRDENQERKGLTIERYFSPADGNVYGTHNWVTRTATFGDFNQENVEMPADWSKLAVGTVASKYFYGALGTSERETSISGLIERVAGTIGGWVLDQGYYGLQEEADIFRDELATLALDQKMAFNSPVWFNVGLHKIAKKKPGERKSSFIIRNDGIAVKIPKGREYEYPQTPACFIQGLEDTMESIMALTTYEAMLFKYGSGTGTDLSVLRSSREELSGGGKPSGPLSYLKNMSLVAGIVRSGGKTRRAAKMDSLKTDHPDIKEFIEAKTLEKQKAEALVAQGYTPEEALESVAYQNVNLSVRATNEFMEAALNGERWKTIPVHSKELEDKMPEHDASELLDMIAKGTHYCGDPGMQFHTTINEWNTCPNSGEIKASNPCSEYMFINDSSCNLASQNLMRFKTESGVFGWRSFGESVKRVAVAQDALIDKSSYPKKTIAQNSHDFRALGQGFSNLGALVMSWALPYDSAEARAAAAVITAYQTGKVYETSTEMAESLGPFKEFEKNREPMMNVIRKHRAALDNIDKDNIPKGLGLEEMLSKTYETWENVEARGEQFGFRNAQATVLAPTGTIGFMMDCDTTGIEPDLALVKTKQLFDGGKVKIVNHSVGTALEKLGYTPGQIERMKDYIERNDTIEGAPELREEHLPVFDCALNAGIGKAKRYISASGHIDMMAAVQPFLSGAISKTVNVPESATVEEIKQIYVDAWRKGLKAVAVYRDKSHMLQPLNAGDGKGLEGQVEEHPVAVRRKLPVDRSGAVHKFNVAGHEGYLVKGEYPGEGRLGELFINMSKEGSTIGGLMDVIGTLTSLSLQHGISLETLVKKFKGQKFDPRGIVFEGDSNIQTATSLVDYIFRHLENVYLNQEVSDDSAKTIDNGNSNFLESQADLDDAKKNIDWWDNIPPEEKGGFCPACGEVMRRVGSCAEYCRCGHKNTNGCGE